MPSNLSGLGNLSYWGVDLSGPYTKTTLTGEPVYDDSGRVVKWWKYTISVTTWIFDAEQVGGVTDSDMTALRRLLSTPGGPLKYSAVGFGQSFEVGSNLTLQDCNYGPKPERLVFKTTAGIAAYIEFTVSTCVPEQCFVASNTPAGKAVAISWDWNVSIKDGWSTIRWVISCEIPMSFSGPQSRSITDVADSLRNKLEPVLLTGFKRGEWDWKLSSDKRRLTGTVTDEEIPVPLPNDLPHFDATHKVNAKLKQKGGFNLWTHTLNGVVRVPPGLSKATAYQRIFGVIASRLAKARQVFLVPDTAVPPVADGAAPAAGPVAQPQGFAGFGNAAPKGGPGPRWVRRMVVITSFELGEKVFGNEIHFAITYEQIGATLASIVNDSGLFRVIDGTSFAAWQGSLLGNGKAFDPRGGAQARYTAAMEGTVIDICVPQQDAILPTTGNGAGPGGANS